MPDCSFYRVVFNSFRTLQNVMSCNASDHELQKVEIWHDAACESTIKFIRLSHDSKTLDHSILL